MRLQLAATCKQHGVCAVVGGTVAWHVGMCFQVQSALALRPKHMAIKLDSQLCDIQFMPAGYDQLSQDWMAMA